MSEKMNWEILFYISVIIAMFGYMAITIIDGLYFMPGRKEAATIQLDIDGISIQEVTINSPNVYFEIDDYEEFKQILHEQNSTQVHYYGGRYYIFNEDYSLAYRIHWETIYEVIKTQ